MFDNINNNMKTDFTNVFSTFKFIYKVLLDVDLKKWNYDICIKELGIVK